MTKRSISFILVFFLILGCISLTQAHNQSFQSSDCLQQTAINANDYGIQWEINYGPDQSGGRYEGPQPIGDCDNDGDNELLIGGRDATLAVMEWNEELKIYEQTHSLHSPFYAYFLARQMATGDSPPNPGGFAIGDLTGDGKNEIASTWYAAVYKWIAGGYRLIGLNSWIFQNGGGNGDCFIGDCDNDGRNELIMSGGGGSIDDSIPEIVVFKWDGWRLVKVAEYNDDVFGYAYMVGLGDPDDDGENEIVCGISSFRHNSNERNKVVVLDWNKETRDFEPSVIHSTYGPELGPFGGWCADSDMDGIDEIHVGYIAPRVTILEWNGTGYAIKFDKEWPGEDMLIEGINVGDVDDDGIPEVCAGTNVVHILQWDGSTYLEEAILDQTYGDLAVVIVGDCDNDGKNEINVAPVYVDQGQDYKYWIFKYGWES